LHISASGQQAKSTWQDCGICGMPAVRYCTACRPPKGDFDLHCEEHICVLHSLVTVMRPFQLQDIPGDQPPGRGPRDAGQGGCGVCRLPAQTGAAGWSSGVTGDFPAAGALAGALIATQRNRGATQHVTLADLVRMHSTCGYSFAYCKRECGSCSATPMPGRLLMWGHCCFAGAAWTGHSLLQARCAVSPARQTGPGGVVL
jgi:hypothetical protein